VLLAHAPGGIEPARLAENGVLGRLEGAETTIVGYGTTTPTVRQPPIDPATWDGKRRFRTSTFRKVVDETWGLWSLPSFVCHGDSGGAIFRKPGRRGDLELLVANVSDGGKDCRSHNNNNRLDTVRTRDWIRRAIEQLNAQRSPPISWWHPGGLRWAIAGPKEEGE
jgi:hypothetical protein